MSPGNLFEKRSTNQNDETAKSRNFKVRDFQEVVIQDVEEEIDGPNRAIDHKEENSSHIIDNNYLTEQL